VTIAILLWVVMIRSPRYAERSMVPRPWVAYRHGGFEVKVAIILEG
jgi:hypothetical protein